MYGYGFNRNSFVLLLQIYCFVLFPRTPYLCTVWMMFSKCTKNLTTSCFVLPWRWVFCPNASQQYTGLKLTILTPCDCILLIVELKNIVHYQIKVLFYLTRIRFPNNQTGFIDRNGHLKRLNVCAVSRRERDAWWGCSLMEAAGQRRFKSARLLWKNWGSTQLSVKTALCRLQINPPLMCLHHWYRLANLQFSQ